MILLTGANGHLGANLLRQLLREGADVRVLLRPRRDNSTVAGLPVDHAFGDLRDPESLARALRGCSHVYHTAAMVALHNRGQEIFEHNVIGTKNLLRAAMGAGVAKVVVSGSLSAVGYVPGQPSDESMPFNPFEAHMPYAFSKAGVEQECLKAAADGLNVVVAISCAILGPWDFKPSRMGRVLVDFANGRMLAYIPGGFEFVTARDIAAGHMLAMDKGRSGQRYIFGSGFRSVDDLMATYQRVTGRARPIRIPAGLMAAVARVSSFVLTHCRPDVPQRFTPASVRLLRMERRADCTRAREELGYRPTSIEDAIQAAYDWFVERGAIRRPAAVAVREVRVDS
ncbi:MAG TPA: NAD-dependent epimerase/dehydratase family protein [Bryobacteraceae bacterium]|nr:NAD-dependent epimerase/dehydratase family protein [Bryobacteraceae bacterium]